MTLVKVCGLRDEATIEQMASLNIDYVGFIFVPGTRRYVSPIDAASLVRAVHAQSGKQAVGVFVNASIEYIVTVVRITAIDVVQLHGEESPAFAADVRKQTGVKQVWKVFNAAHDREVELANYAGVVDAVLIDTAGGGTGKTFDWTVIPAYQAVARAIGVPLFVAGGLEPDNVRHLLEQYDVDGVDVSSGVETEGSKDLRKIRHFYEGVAHK